MGERAISPWLNWHQTPRMSSFIINPYVGDNATILDEFNRANSTDIGANWDSGYTGFANAQIVGNCLRVVSVGDPETAESYNAITPAANQWAQVRLKTFNTGTAGAIFGGVLLRAAAPATLTFYWIAAVADPDGTYTVIRRRVAGVETEVSFTEQIWAQGDYLRVQMLSTGIVVRRNGLQVDSQTDIVIGSGRVGIYMFVDAASSGADIELDDFRAGNL